MRKRPLASIVSAFADGLTSASGPTRTMRSPLTTTLVAGVTLRSRASNNRALRTTRSPRGVCASARAIRSDQAVSVLCCASSNRGIEDSDPSGTTVLNFNMFFDRRLHVIVAATIVFDRHTGTIELPTRSDVIAAAAIVVGIFSAHCTVRLRLNGLAASRVTLDEDFVGAMPR